MKKLLFLVLTFHIHTTQAQEVHSYAIVVDFFPEAAQMWGYPVANQSFMRGSAMVTFSEIQQDTLVFYLHGELKIDSITSAEKKLDYRSEKVLYDEDYSRIGLKTRIATGAGIQKKAITIHYSGFMNPSRARSLSDYMRIDKEDGVFLRGHYYSPWFPVFQQLDEDDYETYFERIRVGLPKGFKAVVMGELVSESIANNRYTAVWKPGTSNISKVQCTARPYRSVSEDNASVYYLNNRLAGEKILDFTRRLKQVFHSNFRSVQGTSTLYILEMPEYGNISSQNVIGLSSEIYRKFDTHLFSKLTVAHELVHPYVQIDVSKNDPCYALVTEGFPSFFHLYGVERLNQDHDLFDLNDYMKQVEQSYLDKIQTGKDRRGNPLPIHKPILDIAADEIGQYKDVFLLPDRVRLFLYHLWTEMGDEYYDRFLKELFKADKINYDILETLIIKYLPGYENNLNIWLNTTHYPKSLHIKS